MNKIILNGWQRLWVVFGCMLFLIFLFDGSSKYNQAYCNAQDFINQYYIIQFKHGEYRLDASILKEDVYKNYTYEQLLSVLFNEKNFTKKIISKLINNNKLNQNEITYINDIYQGYTLSEIQEINDNQNALQFKYKSCQTNASEKKIDIILDYLSHWILIMFFLYITGFLISWIYKGFKLK